MAESVELTFENPSKDKAIEYLYDLAKKGINIKSFIIQIDKISQGASPFLKKINKTRDFSL